MTCVVFSIKFAKTNQKIPEKLNLNFVKKIHYYSELFTLLLGLDLHVDACNEMLRCLPEQTSAELLGWLASLDTL